MADSSYEVTEVRFVIEPELTQVYVYMKAHGDSPLGVQGCHHKTFPASRNVLQIMHAMYGIEGAEHDDPVLWSLEAPK